MFLESLLKKSDNKYLNHFNFNQNGHVFSFYASDDKTEFLCDKSFAETLLEYFQSKQFFPPYLSWELGDMISEHQDEYGYPFISDELMTLELDNNQDILIQIFECINYKVINTQFNEYQIFDSEGESIYGILDFYKALAFFLYKIEGINEEMIGNIIES